jgi:hypothetical protein
MRSQDARASGETILQCFRACQIGRQGRAGRLSIEIAEIEEIGG